MRKERPSVSQVGRSLWLGVLAALASTSCSTILTKAPVPFNKRPAQSQMGHPFSGVRCDGWVLLALFMGPPWQYPLALLPLVDLPLSAVADGVLLPVDMLVPGGNVWDGGCVFVSM